jgi:WhiB family redox-sensing transcriptional regulator
MSRAALHLVPEFVRAPDRGCAGMSPSVFVPRQPRRYADSDLAAAKAACRRCPYMGECLEYAMELTPPPVGVWGGTTEEERRLMRRARRLGIAYTPAWGSGMMGS